MGSIAEICISACLFSSLRLESELYYKRLQFFKVWAETLFKHKTAHSIIIIFLEISNTWDTTGTFDFCQQQRTCHPKHEITAFAYGLKPYLCMRIMLNDQTIFLWLCFHDQTVTILFILCILLLLFLSCFKIISEKRDVEFLLLENASRDSFLHISFFIFARNCFWNGQLCSENVWPAHTHKHIYR